MVHSPTVLLRRSVFESVGLYKENLKQEDFYMWLLISRDFSIGFMSEVLVEYRVLSNSLSKQFKFDGAFYFERLKVSALFLGSEKADNEAVFSFQRKQLKKVFKEGIVRNDKSLIVKGLGFCEVLLKYSSNLKMDQSIFQVYLAFPDVFNIWSDLHGYRFEKHKYSYVYALLKLPSVLKIFKPMLEKK